MLPSEESPVKRTPAGDGDKSYVVRLALLHGALECSRGEDGGGVDAWWARVKAHTWILKVRGVRIGYVAIRPMYCVAMTLEEAAEHRPVVRESVLKSLHLDRVVVRSPCGDPAFERAGFRSAPEWSTGMVYEREIVQ